MTRSVITMAVVALTLGCVLTGLAQNRRADPTAVTEQRPLAAFKMTVSRSPAGVSLTCEKGGCAWEKLGFSLSDKPVAVNDYGMTGGPDNPETKGKFVIRFATDANGFALTCERGCAWHTLSFPATANPVPIDQSGMATKR